MYIDLNQGAITCSRPAFLQQGAGISGTRIVQNFASYTDTDQQIVSQLNIIIKSTVVIIILDISHRFALCFGKCVYFLQRCKRENVDQVMGVFYIRLRNVTTVG
jgi:hypothetical protein